MLKFEVRRSEPTDIILPVTTLSSSITVKKILQNNPRGFLTYKVADRLHQATHLAPVLPPYFVKWVLQSFSKGQHRASLSAPALVTRINTLVQCSTSIRCEMPSSSRFSCVLTRHVSKFPSRGFEMIFGSWTIDRWSQVTLGGPRTKLMILPRISSLRFVSSAGSHSHSEYIQLVQARLIFASLCMDIPVQPVFKVGLG